MILCCTVKSLHWRGFGGQRRVLEREIGVRPRPAWLQVLRQTAVGTGLTQFRLATCFGID